MTSAFSPLEALLLFQHLSNHGVSKDTFVKVSSLLKNDAQIRRSSSYDPGRLSPDSLRDFYLRLLKEEAKSELDAAEGSNGTNGETSSRKRKAPSPSLPTIQEASKDTHLIPQLIRKLYARYREHAIIEIKEDERRFEKLRHDIKEIESGAWDGRLQQEIERGQWDHVLKRKAPAEEKRPDVAVPPTANGPVKQPNNLRLPEDVRRQGADQRTTATPSQSSTPAPSPQPPRQPHQPTSQPSISPRHQAQSPYISHQPSPSAPHSPFPPHPPYQAPPNISPRQDGQSPRAAQSPSMLPPPPPQGYPNQPLPPNPYPQPSQRIPHPPYGHPQTPQNHVPPSPGSYQQYPQSGYQPFQTPQGAMMMQPFTVAPQTPTGPPRQGQTPPTVPNVRTDMPRGPPVAPLSAQPGPLTPMDIFKMLNTPASAVAPSPSKDTVWKPFPGRQRGAPKVPSARAQSPERPHSRSVSPLSERAASPPPETTRKTRRGKPTSAPDTAAPARGTRNRRTRGASATSSIPGSSARGRTRSQSIMSHAEDVSMADNDSIAGRRVKNEPSTPMDSSDFVRPTIEGTPGGFARRNLQSGLNKRKRGQSKESEASEVPLAPRQDKSVVIANRNFNRLSATIMNDIQSHKHASLFSNPVRDRDAEGYSDIIKRPQDLKSIRMAITAGNRAVNAVAASDSFASSTSSQRDASGTLVLPVNEDLVPPKSIVNSGQLEKEVMRMFANAVMFNPGDDDVVQDAREMAEGVEDQIAKFRDVERSSILPTLSEGRRQSEVEPTVEEEETGPGKRRRVG